MTIILVCLVVLVLLCLSEFGWRKGYMTNELGRKFVHITVGSFVAFWPYWLSWNQIRVLSLAFIVVVLLSRFLKIFNALHSVQRPTYGEFFFALTVGLLTFITHDEAIYAAALLQMSLADGMAAVVGVEYGLKYQFRRYHVFGHIKTVIGSLVFFVISAALLFGYSADTTQLALWLIPAIAAGATALEIIGIAGVDNLLVPLFVAALLNRL